MFLKIILTTLQSVYSKNQNSYQKPKLSAIYLKSIPTETFKFILKIQGDAKYSKGISQYSLERTVLKIIEDYQKLTSEIHVPNQITDK